MEDAGHGPHCVPPPLHGGRFRRYSRSDGIPGLRAGSPTSIWNPRSTPAVPQHRSACEDMRAQSTPRPAAGKAERTGTEEAERPAAKENAMHDELLAEFPEVSYEAWRAQVEKDLKGADFEKRLTARTLEGIVVRPLYTARDVAGEPDAAGFAGLSPYRRGGAPFGHHGADWDVRAEQRASDAATARRDIAEDL